MKPKISVVIPVYNDETRLEKMLKSLKRQSFRDFEIVVVDDCSQDGSFGVAKKYADKSIRNDTNRGPAAARNLGIGNAEAEIVVFSDSDCEARDDWLEEINRLFSDSDINIMMGRVIIPESTFVGDSIAALGYPAGGHLGFERMWRVSKEGFTDHLSSCNMAVSKKVFQQCGLFDEDFPLAGAEDTEFSHRLREKNIKIKYNPNAIVIHEPRTSLKSFVRWQITRGRCNYHLKKKIEKVNEYVKLRLWSSKNILKRYAGDAKIILIITLLFLSFFLQQYGYLKESTEMKEISKKMIR